MVNSGNPSKDRVTLRSCYNLHEASQKPNRRRQLFPARFSDDLHSGRRAHQQERLPPIYLPVEASSENTFPHTDLRSDAEIHESVRGGTCDTVLTRASSSRCVYRRQAHPSTSCARRRRRSPSFSLFLSDHCFCVFLSPESPLFLCFLKLYDIFRTLGVVFVDSY